MGDRSDISIRALRMARGGRDVVTQLDLEIKAGSRVAIVGASGVGKSTVLQAIAGLVTPADGTITIGGRPLTGPAPSVTLMLQRPALLPWASAFDNVLLGLRLSGQERLDRAGSRKRATDLLARVGLADRHAAKPIELSGGEQQRVALARALAPNPRILLLDEPFSALDAQTRVALRRDVARLAEDNGVTLMLVTHDLADATALCRRIVRLEGRPARIVADDDIPIPAAASADRAQLATAA